MPAVLARKPTHSPASLCSSVNPQGGGQVRFAGQLANEPREKAQAQSLEAHPWGRGTKRLGPQEPSLPGTARRATRQGKS